MALDVSGLTVYVKENNLPLITKTFLSPKSRNYMTEQFEVKGKSALNLLETSVEFGDGLACGWSEKGSTKLSQRVLEVGHIKINKAYCDKDLIKYWTGYDVRMAAGAETLPFEEHFIDSEINTIGEQLETAIWQGDTTGLTANLNKFDGLIKIIDNATGVKNAINTGISAVTTSNAITVVDNVYSAMPSSVINKKDAVIVCGTDFFRTYVLALRNANLYHYNYNADEGMTLTIPGTSTRLVALDGLDGTNRLFGYRISNVFYGTDFSSDDEEFDFWYSKDNAEFRLKVSFAAGVQIAYPEEIAQFTLA